MITFVLSQRRKDGADVAATVWQDRPFRAASTRGSVISRLARELVAAGCPDQDWQAVGIDGQRRLFGSSLCRLAQQTIKENDRGLWVVAYQAFPDAGGDAGAVLASEADREAAE